MSRSGCVIPRASQRATTSAMPAASPPATRNCHQKSVRNRNVSVIRASNPSPGAAWTAYTSSMTSPDRTSGTTAYSSSPVLPTWTMPSVNTASVGASCPVLSVAPSGVVRITEISPGMFVSVPAAARLATRRSVSRSVSCEDFRSA